MGSSCHLLVGSSVCVTAKWECIDGNIRLENDSTLKEIIAGLQRNPKFKKHYSWFKDIYSKKEKQDCSSSECSIVEWYIGVVARFRSRRSLWSWCYNTNGEEFILLNGVGQRSELSTEMQGMSELQVWYNCKSMVTATTAYTWNSMDWYNNRFYR